jgi:hypothetical protein
MSPAAFLALSVSVTAGAAIANRLTGYRRRRRLRRAAAQWNLHYSAGDRFRLLRRLAERFPVPGAADVRIGDLMYGVRQDHYQYIFTADFTIGLVRTKHRIQRIIHFSEPRDRSAPALPHIELAPAALPLLEQYRHFAAPPATPPVPSDTPPSASA